MNTCPHCQSPEDHWRRDLFTCGKPKATNDRTPICFLREITQLRERMKRLEEVLNRILDNDGSRVAFRAVALFDAKEDAEKLLKEAKP